MPFQARKLRVQLPCSVEGSLVELADEGPREPGPAQRRLAAELPTLPHTCYSFTILDYCHCSIPPRTLPQLPVCIEIDLPSLHLVALAEQPQRLVEPDLLPLLKRQLENRLAELGLTTEVVKNRMEALLDDIAVAERGLRDRQARDQDQGPDA